MSAEQSVKHARDILVSLLRNFEHKHSQLGEPGEDFAGVVKNRKLYWRCMRSSKLLWQLSDEPGLQQRARLPQPPAQPTGPTQSADLIAAFNGTNASPQPIAGQLEEQIRADFTYSDFTSSEAIDVDMPMPDVDDGGLPKEKTSVSGGQTPPFYLEQKGEEGMQGREEREEIEGSERREGEDGEDGEDGGVGMGPMEVAEESTDASNLHEQLSQPASAMPPVLVPGMLAGDQLLQPPLLQQMQHTPQSQMEVQAAHLQTQPTQQTQQTHVQMEQAQTQQALYLQPMQQTQSPQLQTQQVQMQAQGQQVQEVRLFGHHELDFQPPPASAPRPSGTWPPAQAQWQGQGQKQGQAYEADKLSERGFNKLRRNLKRSNSSMYLTVGDAGRGGGFSHAAFCYDGPMPGWTREVSVRVAGKSRGELDVHFVSEQGKRLKSRQALAEYLARSNLLAALLTRFDFHKVYCVCHTTEDNSRPYLECSYGFAGCNQWVHPECVGLGRRSNEECSLLPRVVCPFCSHYLRGAGELADIVGEDGLALEHTTIDPPDHPEFTDNDPDSAQGIEATHIPHVLYGLQGTPFVYCPKSKSSGLTREMIVERDRLSDGGAKSADTAGAGVAGVAAASMALQSGTIAEMAVAAVVAEVVAGAGSSNGVGFGVGMAVGVDKVEGDFSRNAGGAAGTGTAGTAPAPAPAPAPTLAPTLARSRAPAPLLMPLSSDFASSILQHRLFSGWLPPTGPTPQVPEGQASGENRDSKVNWDSKTPTPALVNSDDEIPSYRNTEPVDRVRRAKLPSGLVQVRVEAGGMERKRKSSDADLPSRGYPSSDSQLASASASATLKNGAGAGAGMGEAMDEDGMTAEEREHRVLLKASELHASSLAARLKLDLVEAGVNCAFTNEKRRKTHKGDSEVYRTRPSLFHLPVEDGGLRYTTLASAVVPRSLHPLCAGGKMCAFCLTYRDDEAAVLASSAEAGASAGAGVAGQGQEGHGQDQEQGNGERGCRTKKPKKKGAKPSLDDLPDSVPPEVDRFDMVPVQCGAVSYQIHKQCANQFGRVDLLEVSGSSGNSGGGGRSSGGVDNAAEVESAEDPITLGSIYEYTDADDADCDLCARRGGVMQFFQLSSKASSVPPPGSDGWLAHIPCLFHLQRSRILEPPLTHPAFAENAFSFRIVRSGAGAGTGLGIGAGAGTGGRAGGNAGAEADGSGVSDEIFAALDSTAAMVHTMVDVLAAEAGEAGAGAQEKVEAEAETATEGVAQSLAQGSRYQRYLTALRAVYSEHIRMEAESAAAQKTEAAAEVHSKILLSENRFFAPAPRSRFDHTLGHWRCALCGIQAGVALRCMAAGCTVRAHMLCATLADEWVLCALAPAGGGGGSLGVLCSLHSASVVL